MCDVSNVLLQDAASEGGPTHGNARFNRYVQSGVGQVEAFALATSPLASALFDRVIAAGLEPGPAMELAAELLVKEIWYTVRAAHAQKYPEIPSVCARLQRATHHRSDAAHAPSDENLWLRETSCYRVMLQKMLYGCMLHACCYMRSS